MNWKSGSIILFFLLILFFSCQKEETKTENYYSVPTGFPLPSFPSDNEYTDDRFLLGRKLFFDPILSLDSSISCASCHKPEFAFTDRKVLSEGVMSRIGTRNAPSLGNVAYHPYLLREGGVPTLEMQVGVPIQEHNEFDFNILLIAERLNALPDYVDMSLRAYNRKPDAFVITRSIACFERTLLSGNSAFDHFNRGDSSALSLFARRGLLLFNSPELKCSQCHSGINFTNYAFTNNGLYKNDPDIGRMRLTGKEEDRSLYKVPSLRNVVLTFPYMHDGSFSSLENIIDHYAKGGNNNSNQSPLITGFTISDQQKTDLINFLKSLTDYQFINNPNFKIK